MRKTEKWGGTRRAMYSVFVWAARRLAAGVLRDGPAVAAARGGDAVRARAALRAGARGGRRVRRRGRRAGRRRAAGAAPAARLPAPRRARRRAPHAPQHRPVRTPSLLYVQS